MNQTISKKNIYIELLELIRNKKPCVLSTVTKTEGSTPQKEGSSAIFGQQQVLAGTVGGGVVELKVQNLAANAIGEKESGYYSFNLDNGISYNSEAICGGVMNILLDASPEIHAMVFEELKCSCLNRIPGVLFTSFNKAKTLHGVIDRTWITKQNFEQERPSLSPEISESISKMLDNVIEDDFIEITTLATEEEENSIICLETIVPSPHLIIAGAGHVGKALSHMANLLNFDVTVWDDRVEFANKENLPDAHKILSGNLEETLGETKLDSTTYLVIVTRGHKNDADVLKTFIKSSAAYIGMIGSKKKIGLMRKMFLNKKWVTQDEWNRVYSPIGLDIHSKTVQEIAVSIAAQLVMVRNQKNRKNE